MFARLDFAKLSLMDALDLAILIETEALDRYKMFAEQLGYTGPGDASSIFKEMAKHEAVHANDLLERRKEMFGDAPMRVSRDDIYDVEAPDPGSPRWNMSPKAALEVALSSEKKAFRFYDLALQSVTDPKIVTLFTELRDEETEHVRIVTTAMARLPEGSDQELVDVDEW